MVNNGEPPPGGGGVHSLPQAHSSHVRPGKTFAGAAQAAGGTVPGGRSWQQIFKEAKEKRNILEIHIKPINCGEDPQQKPKPLLID